MIRCMNLEAVLGGRSWGWVGVVGRCGPGRYGCLLYMRAKKEKILSEKKKRAAGEGMNPPVNQAQRLNNTGVQWRRNGKKREVAGGGGRSDWLGGKRGYEKRDMGCKPLSQSHSLKNQSSWGGEGRGRRLNSGRAKKARFLTPTRKGVFWGCQSLKVTLGIRRSDRRKPD